MLKSKRGKAAEWVNCERCGNRFLKEIYEIHKYPHHFCSGGCFRREDTTETFSCAECGEPIERQAARQQKSKSGQHFCCRSHAATYNNRLRRKSRRSKIEAKFFDLLIVTFPDLEMIPNDKGMLPGIEVDIAIPSLRLAIEWNGIVHFQPIYGQERLDIIQKRDAMKSQLAADLQIRLVIINDTDSSKRTLNRAYDDVCEIISALLE